MRLFVNSMPPTTWTLVQILMSFIGPLKGSTTRLTSLPLLTFLVLIIGITAPLLLLRFSLLLDLDGHRADGQTVWLMPYYYVLNNIIRMILYPKRGDSTFLPDDS